jgi:anionic cell wall polymer biosynthesis LytR-Cps2A-Psr (LCP) family protein
MSKKVTFRTERKTIRNNRILLIAVIVIALAGIAAFSAYSIFSEGGSDMQSSDAGDAQAVSSPGDGNAVTARGERYYLFWCKDSGSGELKLIWVVGIRLPQGKYTVYSPSIDDTVEYKGEYHSLGEIFSLYDVDGLREAVDSLCGVKTVSYIGSDSANFRQMINHLGAVTVDIDEPINYNKDFNLILGKGENDLKGDTLYKYLVYTNFMQGDTRKIRAEAMTEILRNTVTPKKADKIDTIFARIANLLISDITVVNYSADREFINGMFSTGVKSVNIAEKPAQITK